MLTLIETPLFTNLWPDYWTEEERGQFCSWLSLHPDVGDVIPRSGGCRKVRWSRAGMGKRGGVRVIYYLQRKSGEIWLLLIYSKNVQESLPAHVLQQLRKEVDDADD
ncbi:transcriptional regulator [Acidithiobacillus ferriphilus]|nr:transcriptional regulator [Acidithiobacillus ferriphilus]MBW9250284.1 transcriptional regulator [Acidithiobacillus ferriphilus]MBW9254343.1 transcriptional regulator [Acidithiobacillus ferriphilus]